MGSYVAPLLMFSPSTIWDTHETTIWGNLLLRLTRHMGGEGGEEVIKNMSEGVEEGEEVRENVSEEGEGKEEARTGVVLENEGNT